jgi:hypothetical protein
MTEPLEPDQPTQPEATPDVEPEGPEVPTGTPEQPDEETEAEEADEPAEGEPPADEPPTDQPEPQGLSDEEAERIGRQLDKERTRHSNRVSEIMGEWAQPLEACPLCEPNIPGFIFPPAQTAARDELHARLLQVLSTPARRKLNRDPTKVRCEVCDGAGKLEVDTDVPTQKETMCGTCNGKGWVGQGGFAETTRQTNEVVSAVVASNGQTEPQPDTDPFGSPKLLDSGMENPNWGRMPQFKDPAFP